MSRALALVDAAGQVRQHESTGPASQLLETKFYVPRARSGLVPRPRLLDAVGQGAAGRLTVVVAPAGFGKTTLVSSWVAAGERPAAWLSLDAGDNDPSSFWSHVIGALRRVVPGIGEDALASLAQPRPAPVERLLASVINDLDGSARDVVLVLDDYHVIDNAEIHRAMRFLLDRLPARLHVVVATRAEPPLALARRRARGELAELRAGDLRFTADEAFTFLTDVMGIDLARGDATALERRTEGWIAGLKLAALSMQARGDVRGFVDAFSSDNRFIADYLVEEVLEAEGDAVRHFLLGTALLDRLSGSLCDAVTGGRDGQALLEDLERRSLFIVPLDDRREWFRYHHLFAEVLQRQAVARDAGAVRDGHRRASEWYETRGAVHDAVRHAIAAGDAARAAGLLERAWPEKDRSRESARWLAEVRSVPDDAVRARPVLSMGYAWALLNSGELEAAEPRLRDVERWLQAVGDQPAAASRMLVSDEHRFATLDAELAAARIYLTQALGDVPGTLEHAQRALDLTPESDDVARITPMALLALAQWGRGDLDAAHGTFSRALSLMRRTGRELDVIRGIFVLGDIRVAQGRLREAARTYEDGLREASTGTHASPPETDELYLGLAEVHREWNDLAGATALLDECARAAERSAHVGTRRRWCMAMASIRASVGEPGAALSLLDEGERHRRRDPIPRARPIEAMRARLRLAQGQVQEAAAWAARAKVSAGDDLTYLREYEHVTLARILLARSSGDALPLLERLLVVARTGGRLGSVVEILALRALALHAQGNVRGALDAVAEALSLAEPEGFVRVFLDEGDRMRTLLRQATARGLAGEYARRVLLAFEAPGTAARTTSATTSAAASASAPATAGASAALTARELEILRLIAGGLRNQAIADELSISAATVKRHIANAYGKLGAEHRVEALKRARELKLL